MTSLSVRGETSFADRNETLTHIGNEILAEGAVHDIWSQVSTAREVEFSTEIMLK